MGTKFKEGQVVVERIRPLSKLIVSRYDCGIYYCKVFEGRLRKELVYLEHDLKAMQT